jgi:hypothetical protein
MAAAVSTSAAPVLAGVLLFGPPAALVLSLASALIALGKNRSRLSGFLFNASNQLVAAMIINGLLRSQGLNFFQLPLWLQFLICLEGMVIVYLSNTLLAGIGLSLEVRLPLREIWKEKFSWLLPYYVAMSLVAWALVYGYRTAGLPGVLMVLVPLGVLRYSQKQYIGGTRVISLSLERRIMNWKNAAGRSRSSTTGCSIPWQKWSTCGIPTSWAIPGRWLLTR